MFVPPLMTLLQGEPAPTPFYSATKVLNGDWFTVQGPAAIYFADLDKTFVAWQMVGNGGNKGCQIAAYDHATETWSERYKVGNFILADDNHGSAAIVRDADGFVYVFFGAHDTTQPWSISTAANDITAWTPQAPLGTQLTYPHACLVGSTLHVFWRNDVTSSRRTLVRSSATPSSGSATFAALSTIVDLDADSRVYMGEAIVVGSDIHIVATRANAADTERKHVYYFVYKTATGALENHDGSVSTASGSLPINLTTANASYRLFDHGSGQGDIPSLCFDSSGNPHILFLDNGGSGTTYTLKHIKRTAGTWSSPVSVNTVGVTFPSAGGYIATYSCVAGAADTVEAWYINSSGDKLRNIRDASGTWGAAQTIKAAGANRLDDNQSVRNAKADFRVIYGEISTAFTDASAVFAGRYGHGDSGPIAAAIPMTADDSSYSSVSLLLGFNQRDAAVRTVEDSDKCLIPTFNGNAQIDTAQSKFGGASLLLDGTGDFLTFPDNALFKVSQGDFTVEMWVRRNATKLQALVAKRPAAGATEWAFYVNASNQLQAQCYNTSTLLNITSTGTLSSTSVWYHCALSRQGTTWRMFLDGTLDGSGTESATPAANTQLLHIGRDLSNSARDFSGWIDEFRFTSGVARYTASFTAPSAAFPRR